MAIVGYFAFLDLNLTSGSVKYVAEYESLGKRRELFQVISFGLIIYMGIGLLGMALIFALGDMLVSRVFKVPPKLKELAVNATQLASVGFFLGQFRAYLQSIPQALRRYTITAKIEVAFGFLIPLLTVAVLMAGYGLFEIIALRVVLSVFYVATLLVVFRRLLLDFRFSIPDRRMFMTVGSFSGFAYLGKLAAVIYYQADKLIISAIIGVVGLAYYVVPFQLATRIMDLSLRMAQVVYPEGSRLGAMKEYDKLHEIYFSATRYIFFINVYFIITVALFGHEILQYWMGPQFAANGALIMTLIMTAILMDSMTNIPALVNDGLGHPKVTGAFAFLRVILGLSMVALGTHLFGILGAAMGQVVTFAVYSASFLIFVHGRTLPYKLGDLLRQSYLPIVVPAVLLIGCFHLLRPVPVMGLLPTALYAALAALCWTVFGYLFVLKPEHKAATLSMLRAKMRRPAQATR